MRCAECAEGKRFSAESVYCLQYGMIIRDSHECTLPGQKEKTADVGASAGVPSETDERRSTNEL